VTGGGRAARTDASGRARILAAAEELVRERSDTAPTGLLPDPPPPELAAARPTPTGGDRMNPSDAIATRAGAA
jgi:hypothetical protein